MDDFISTWAQAIATFEGFSSSGSRAQRNNNPGNLKYAGQAGATGQDSGGFAIFPDVATGFQALYAQLAKYVSSFPSFTILQAMARYLGQTVPTNNAQGNAFTYATFVANALGVTVDSTIGDLAAAAASAIQVAANSGSTDTTAALDASQMMDVSSSSYQPSSGEMVGILAFSAVAFWLIGKLFHG